MNGIVINVDPVALSLGHVHINWYSIFVLLAILAAIGMAIYQGKKTGMASESILSAAPWVILGGFIGARLFHVVDRWEYYSGDPIQMFMVQQGGLAIWGGLAGGGLAGVVFAGIKRIPLGRLADTLVPALLLAQIIGRFACIINGDAAGGVTTLPWGFVYINPNAMISPQLFNVPTHPYPVYEMLWNLVGLALALKLYRSFRVDGILFMSYLSFYAVGRLMFTFVRQEKVWIWGLQEAQIVAIAILAVSAVVAVYLLKRQRTKAIIQA